MGWTEATEKDGRYGHSSSQEETKPSCELIDMAIIDGAIYLSLKPGKERQEREQNTGRMTKEEQMVELLFT